MLKQMKKANIKGFSLIELMVVVAIIGILAAIAVPNFQRFQRRARQAEGRGLLGGLSSAMEAFRAEWEVYYGDMQDVGFAPAGTLRYNVGFTAVGAAPTDPAFTSSASGWTDTNDVCGAVVTCTASPAGAVVGSVAPAGQTYTAAAIGDVGGAASDQWTMNQVKVFANTVNGTF